METVKHSKFNWGELSELNSGHTPEEWGITTKPNMVINSKDFWNCDE